MYLHICLWQGEQGPTGEPGERGIRVNIYIYIYWISTRVYMCLPNTQ